GPRVGWGIFFRPGRIARRAAPDEPERFDGLFYPVLENLKIIRGQVCHRAALPVPGHYVQRDFSRGDAEFLLALLSRCNSPTAPGIRGDDQRESKECSDRGFHDYPPSGLKCSGAILTQPDGCGDGKT